MVEFRDQMTAETPKSMGTIPPESNDRPSEWQRLDQVQPGQCGIVSSVSAGESEVDRLKAMGVCVGRKLMMVRAGDPMIVKVFGSRIGISARLANNVMVLPCGGDYFGQA